MEKEQWKDDVLSSLDGAQRAQPSDMLYGKIQQRISNLARAGQMQVVRRPYLALAAACLAALICANVYALSKQNTIHTTQSNSAYQIDAANFDLY